MRRGGDGQEEEWRGGMRRQEEGTMNWEEEGEGWMSGGRWSDDGGAMSGRGGGSCGKMGREVGGPRVRFQPHAQKPSTNMPMGLATNIANTSLHCFAQTRHSICFSGLLVCVGGVPPWCNTQQLKRAFTDV